MNKVRQICPGFIFSQFCSKVKNMVVFIAIKIRLLLWSHKSTAASAVAQEYSVFCSNNNLLITEFLFIFDSLCNIVISLNHILLGFKIIYQIIIVLSEVLR